MYVVNRGGSCSETCEHHTSFSSSKWRHLCIADGNRTVSGLCGELLVALTLDLQTWLCIALKIVMLVIVVKFSCTSSFIRKDLDLATTVAVAAFCIIHHRNSIGLIAYLVYIL